MADHSAGLGDAAAVVCACHTPVDRRIPAMVVPINHGGRLSAEFKSCFGSGLHWWGGGCQGKATELE